MAIPTKEIPTKKIQSLAIYYYFALALGILLAALTMRLPDVLPANAALGDFSAARAFFDIKEISKAPHEIGSAEHLRVQNYLLNRLAKMNMDVRLTNDIGYSEHSGTSSRSAPIANITGTIKGKNPALPALLLMSHYDTQTNSPGAADDSAGIATSLEIARMISAKGVPERDVILLFTDGEEFGLLGAQAFFANPRKANHIGVVINLEARGDSGPAVMFETGPNNSGLIEMFAKHGRGISANSLASAIYKKMPNGTDFSHVGNKAIAGLNFAFAGNELAYHTKLSTPENLNLKSVQHMGNQAAPVAVALAFSKTLPKAQTNSVYSDLLGRVFLSYDVAFAWVIAGAIIILFIVCFWQTYKNDERKLLPLLRAVAGLLALSLFAVSVLVLCSSWLIGLGHFGRIAKYDILLFAACLILLASISIFSTWLNNIKWRNFSLLLVALATLLSNLVRINYIALAIGLICIGLIWLSYNSTPIKARILWLGGLFLNAILSVILCFLMPEATPIIAWPCILGLISYLIIGFSNNGDVEKPFSRAVLIVSSAAILAFVISLGSFLFLALGADEMAVVAVLLLVAAVPLLPLLQIQTTGNWNGIIGLCLLAFGALFVVYAKFAPNSASGPLPLSITRVQDIDKNLAYIIAGANDLDPYSRRALGVSGQTPRRAKIDGILTSPKWWVLSKTTTTAPIVTEAKVGNSFLVIKVKPRANDISLNVIVKTSFKPSNISVNSRPIANNIGDESNNDNTINILRYLPTKSGILIKIPVPQSGNAKITIKASQNNWPENVETLPPKPQNTMGIYQDGFNTDIMQKNVEW